MKKLLFILILLQVPAFAQKLSPQAEQLKYYLGQLKLQPHAPILQMKYIEIFPGNQFDFMEMFSSHTKHELTTNGKDYVKQFRKLGADYPDSVLKKAIAIGKDMPTWSAGPVDELQKAVYYITNEHPNTFLNLVRDLKKNEQATLANFLYASADGKNVNYDILVDIFDKTGERKIKKIFEEAPAKTEE